VADPTERVESTGITLYPSELAILEEADTGRAGRSATIRRIIQEWKEFKTLFSRMPAGTILNPGRPLPNRLTDPGVEYITDASGRWTRACDTDGQEDG